MRSLALLLARPSSGEAPARLSYVARAWGRYMTRARRDRQGKVGLPQGAAGAAGSLGALLLRSRCWRIKALGA